MKLKSKSRSLVKRGVRGVRAATRVWAGLEADPSSEAQRQRLLQVLHGDRALLAAQARAEAQRAVQAPAAAARASDAPRRHIVCNEPIRTRSMARLLAAHGHRERALSIYAVLLDTDPEDLSLQREVAALRSAATVPA